MSLWLVTTCITYRRDVMTVIKADRSTLAYQECPQLLWDLAILMKWFVLVHDDRELSDKSYCIPPESTLSRCRAVGNAIIQATRCKLTQDKPLHPQHIHIDWLSLVLSCHHIKDKSCHRLFLRYLLHTSYHGRGNKPQSFKSFRAPSQYKDRLIYVWRFPC